MNLKRIRCDRVDRFTIRNSGGFVNMIIKLQFLKGISWVNEWPLTYQEDLCLNALVQLIPLKIISHKHTKTKTSVFCSSPILNNILKYLSEGPNILYQNLHICYRLLQQEYSCNNNQIEDGTTKEYFTADDISMLFHALKSICHFIRF
jgi:hypothetical protein